MENNSNIAVVKDLPNKTIKVTRAFKAAPDKVWQAWTDSAILDQWWAPKPWRAETKTMDFKIGGYWLYAMVGPDGGKHWNKIDFKEIDAPKSFVVDNYFCDEDGNKNNDMPVMVWRNEFVATETGTNVIVDISFAKDADIKKILEMGFEGGFTMGLNNLEEYLAANK